MAGGHNSIFGRVMVWLVCMVVIGAVVGCTPKLPVGMSGEDIYTCDDNAWEGDEPIDNYENYLDTRPYLAPAGDVDLWSPLTGSILPYGEPVVIKFDQPPATDGVLFRNYRVIVTSITGEYSGMEWVGGEWEVVGMSSYSIQVTWTPPGSGKYIINVFLRNLETLDYLLGNPINYSEELAHVDSYISTGPFSAAHVCVQIDAPHAGQIVPQQPGTIGPVQNVTLSLPSATRTATLRPSATRTPTLTPTNTIPTSTFTRVPPTPVPPTPIPPTDIPPTEVVSCSSYTNERSCVANDACKWESPPTGGPKSCINK